MRTTVARQVIYGMVFTNTFHESKLFEPFPDFCKICIVRFVKFPLHTKKVTRQTHYKNCIVQKIKGILQ